MARGNSSTREGHRDGEPVGGQFADQPGPHFGRTFSRAKNASGPLEDLDLHLQDPVAAAQPDQLRPLVPRHPRSSRPGAPRTGPAPPPHGGTPEAWQQASTSSSPRRSSPQIRCPENRVKLPAAPAGLRPPVGKGACPGAVRWVCQPVWINPGSTARLVVVSVSWTDLPPAPMTLLRGLARCSRGVQSWCFSGEDITS